MKRFLQGAAVPVAIAWVLVATAITGYLAVGNTDVALYLWVILAGITLILIPCGAALFWDRGGDRMTALSFTPERIEQIKRGEKTQTRRPVKDGEWMDYVGGRTVFSSKGRTKWSTVGLAKRRAIKPGRTASGVGYVRFVYIWRERVEAISFVDAQMEGFANREEFLDAWRGMYGTTDGECWVLEFEYIGEGKPQ